MLSWDEVDNEDTGAAVIKGANAGHATEANMDRLDGAGAAAPKPEKIQAHGVTRPADGTSTGRVWAISDELSKAAGKPIERKAVMEKGVSEGLNPATIATQYGKWRVFNGLKGVVAEKAPKPPKAPKVKKGAEAPVIEGGAAPQGEQSPV